MYRKIREGGAYAKKVPLKNTSYFRNYKKQISNKKIHYFTTDLLSEICLFYISKNIIYFLTGLFCIHISCIYLSIYLTS
jgi:hypothetical protein